MVLNRYCPAVSQICNFTTSSEIVIDLNSGEQVLESKVNTDGCQITFLKSIISKSPEKRRLTHSTIPHQHHFEQITIISNHEKMFNLLLFIVLWLRITKYAINSIISKMQNKVEATVQHCKHCFDVLKAYLRKEATPAWPNLPEAEAPLFITWKKHGDLRGCIGTFQPSLISKLIPEYAITSSIHDPRFDPVQEEEVKSLTVHVSLLVNFQEKNDIYDWEVGKNGIIIKSNYQGRMYSGTFLPEVAQ